MNVDNILNWFANIIKTTPDGVIQGLITTGAFFILKKVLKKLPVIGQRFSEWSNKLSNFFNKNALEISENTIIIPTPRYKPGLDFKIRKKPKQDQTNKNMSYDDFLGNIVLLLIVIVLIIYFFLRYTNEISLFLKWYGLVPLFSSIVIIFIVAISGRVQKSTLIYLFYSIPISILTIYYGNNLLTISEGMSATVTDSRFISSIYIIFGLLIAVAQQFIAYSMMFRNLLIHFARKRKVSEFIKRTIYNLSFLESQIFLIIMIIVFSVLSYLMTSGMLISWIQNWSK
jgi:membrane protein